MASNAGVAIEKLGNAMVSSFACSNCDVAVQILDQAHLSNC